jgi:hypothetical protein
MKYEGREAFDREYRKMRSLEDGTLSEPIVVRDEARGQEIVFHLKDFIKANSDNLWNRVQRVFATDDAWNGKVQS